MKKTITIALLLFTIVFVNAQNFDYGKVSIEEVKNNIYQQDTSASAAILYKFRDTYIDHEHPDGFVIVTEIHERVKILKKDGLDHATKKIPLYHDNSSKERISGLKGLTYFLEDGKLKDEKLRRSSVFENKVSDNIEETSFTMPNVAVGSVVEWSYKITSPFFKIDDLIIQEDIPTKHYHAKIQTLSYFNFKRIAKGGFSVSPREYSEPRSLSYSYEQSTTSALTQETKSAKLQTTEYVSEYELRDIPALKEEPYVDNVDNYRFLITYELTSTEFPKSGLKRYSTSWEEVVKTIYKSKYFGDQLEKNRFFKDDLEAIKAKSQNQLELLGHVFEFVKNKMNWNEKYGKYTDKGVQAAYDENIGNVSEINLILVSMLRASGIKANPVLVSTRKNGIPVFPTIEGFNYVIASAEMNDNVILMDATEKNAIPGILPDRAMNWEGTIILGEDALRKVDLYPSSASQQNTLLSVTINDDGSINGEQNISFSDHSALEYRNQYKNIDKDTYIESLLNRYQFDDLTDHAVENMNLLEEPIKEFFAFEIEEGVNIIGNDIIFSPLFHLSFNSNPFKLADRSYPVNFVYPFTNRKIVNVRIPEGYAVTSLPQAIRMSLPDNMGSFMFNISEVEGGLSIMSSFNINSAVIPSFRYAELKEFYNQRVLKETEKVVLTKI